MKFIPASLAVLATCWGSAHAATPVDNWLHEHSGYRLAADADCGCAEALKLRAGVNPYRVTGDFDGDGKPDEAVVVVNTKVPKDFLILVFASRFSNGRSPLVYGNWFGSPLTGLALFKFEMKTPTVLAFGAFDSEAEPIRLPTCLPSAR